MARIIIAERPTVASDNELVMADDVIGKSMDYRLGWCQTKFVVTQVSL